MGELSRDALESQLQANERRLNEIAAMFALGARCTRPSLNAYRNAEGCWDCPCLIEDGRSHPPILEESHVGIAWTQPKKYRSVRRDGAPRSRYRSGLTTGSTPASPGSGPGKGPGRSFEYICVVSI